MFRLFYPLLKLGQLKYITNQNNISNIGNINSNGHNRFIHKGVGNNISQHSLRDRLIKVRPHECIICDKKLPLCLLEAAHLKPLYCNTHRERNNYNIVEFMCRYCHTLYDRGLIGVNESVLVQSSQLDISKYDLSFPDYKVIKAYNKMNEQFFSYHYENIYHQ
jgi:hypothetical protein